MGESAARADRGAVTAETVMTLPLLLAVTVGLVWLLAIGSAQIQMVDAARETARAVARGDSHASALGTGRRIAPRGADISVASAGEHVTVRATADVDGPGGLFDFLPSVRLSAESVALLEDTGASDGGP